MEYEAAGLFCFLQPYYLLSRGMGGGISFRCQDDIHSTGVFPFHLFLFQGSFRAGKHDLRKIAFKKRQNGFRLRVSEAAVKFHHFGSVFCNHQSGIKAAFKRAAFFFHCFDSRQQNGIINDFVQFFRHDRSGSISPHAAGIRSHIPVADALMILCGNHRNDSISISEAENTRLFPFHKFFNHHGFSRAAKGFSLQHPADRLNSLLFGFGNDDALPRRQSVCLDDKGIFLSFFDIRNGLFFIGKCFISSCRDLILFHQIFGETFRTFNLRCRR